MGSDTNDPFSNLTRMWMEMAANAMQAWQPAAGRRRRRRCFAKAVPISCRSGAIGASS